MRSGGSTRRSSGRRVSRPHAQVLRNQICGSRCSGAGVGAVVGRLDDDHDVVRCGLGVAHRDVEEPVAVEDAGVGEFELAIVAVARGVLAAQPVVGELRLRVAVQPAHPRVGGRAVDRPPVLLDVLAVVALAVGQPEVALLEHAVVAVPQRDREVQEAVAVADAAQAVLAPPVGALVRLLEGQVRPGVAVGGVVLAHRAPLPSGQVRTPQPPRARRLGRLAQPDVLGGLARSHAAQPGRSKCVAPTA